MQRFKTLTGGQAIELGAVGLDESRELLLLSLEEGRLLHGAVLLSLERLELLTGVG